MFGICNLSVVPCRIEASDRSEMVSQLLFGEGFRILEENKSWTKIKMAYDGYECWIGSKQYLPISGSEFMDIEKSKQICSFELVQVITAANDLQIPILLGSSLPKFVNKSFFLDAINYHYEGLTNEHSTTASRKAIIENAFLYLHAPYLWGGRNPFGIDCSGFTQMVFKLNGVKLKRDAIQQAEQGETLSFLEEAEEGDLAFFDNEEGKIIHVGIILNNNKIIHASGKVRIDSIDHEGIFNVETQKYSHRLRILKRILS
jgi:hypothetical protein